MNTFPRSEARKTCLAKALYDNLAETPDELAFRRDDVLVVLEQNTDGLEGWWLCSLRGRQGIVPGNRLKLLPGVYDPAQALKVAAQLHATQGRFRRSWSPNAKGAARSPSTNSLPRARSGRTLHQHSAETYDTVPPPVSVAGASSQEDYDSPRPLRNPPPPPPASVKPTRSPALGLTSGGGAATYSSSTLPSSRGSDISCTSRADALSAANRCSGLSTTSAGSSVRSSSSSSSNRSSLEQAPEVVALRRPRGIPENGLYDASTEEYDVPRHVGVSAVWQPAAGDQGQTHGELSGRNVGAAHSFPTPRLFPESREYDFPPSCRDEVSKVTYHSSQPSAQAGNGNTYETPPPPRVSDTYETPPPPRVSDTYETPPPPRASDTYETPPPPRVSDTYETPPPPRVSDTYETPPPPRVSDTYETPPPPRVSDTYETPPPPRVSDTYETPPPPRVSDTYETPPPPRVSEMQSLLRQDSSGTYDVPVPASRLAELEIDDSPRSCSKANSDSPNDVSGSFDTYDYPRPAQDVYDFPHTVMYSHPSSQSEIDIYDSPRMPADASPCAAQPHGSSDSLLSTSTSQRTSTLSDASASSDGDVILRGHCPRGGSTASRNATYWLRSAGSASGASLSSCGELRQLPLDMDAGLETACRLEQELTATVARLFTFVVPGWRSAAQMEDKTVDLKLAVVRMRTALRELVQFAYGAVVATARGPEHRLGSHFVQVVRPLDETMALIDSAAEAQEHAGWTATALCRPEGAPADALDQLLACAQSLAGDVRQLVAFVRANASLIFRRRVSLVSEHSVIPPSWPRPGPMADYDYVRLQTTGSLVQEGEEVRGHLPEELRGSFDNLIKESQVQVSYRADANDQQVIEFYRGQTECHHEFLNNAIDALFQTIQNNQPPKVFVAHSKFVILSAHKLVYIGDTVHRNVVHVGVRRDALAAADTLFASLRRTVQSTKTAALQFPSAHAVREMTDAVLDVSRAAGELKLVMDEAAI